MDQDAVGKILMLALNFQIEHWPSFRHGDDAPSTSVNSSDFS
jgi:hypothetical protein